MRLITIIILGICSLGHAADPPNYCHDKETNDYWDALAIEYVDRMDVTNLVKLRKQLCRQIDTGEISVYDATKIFERERASVVEGLEKGKF